MHETLSKEERAVDEAEKLMLTTRPDDRKPDPDLSPKIDMSRRRRPQ